MVLHSLLLAQHWIETFCVEIAVINLVPPRLQSLDDLAMQHRAETTSDWIGIQNQDSQRRVLSVPPRGVVRQRGCKPLLLPLERQL